MVDGSRLNVLQNVALAPMTTTSSSSRSIGAFDDSTSAIARLVTVSFGSGIGSTIPVVHELDRFHNMIGVEGLLDECMPWHSHFDLTGARGDEQDRYQLFGANRLHRPDSTARPQLDIGRDQV